MGLLSVTAANPPLTSMTNLVVFLHVSCQKQRFIVAAALLLNLGLLVAAEKPSAQSPGTRRMAERLRQHIQSTGLKNPNANLQRVEKLRAQLALSNSPAEVFGLKLDVAIDLLNGGKSEAALKEFQSVRQYLVGLGKLTPDNAAQLRH